MAHLLTISYEDRSTILLRIPGTGKGEDDDGVGGGVGSSADRNHHRSTKSPYHSAQTLSFQIYTGGAPAFIPDEVTGERKRNPECFGCKCSITLLISSIFHPTE